MTRERGFESDNTNAGIETEKPRSKIQEQLDELEKMSPDLVIQNADEISHDIKTSNVDQLGRAKEVLRLQAWWGRGGAEFVSLVRGIESGRATVSTPGVAGRGNLDRSDIWHDSRTTPEQKAALVGEDRMKWKGAEWLAEYATPEEKKYAAFLDLSHDATMMTEINYVEATRAGLEKSRADLSPEQATAIEKKHGYNDSQVIDEQLASLIETLKAQSAKG